MSANPQAAEVSAPALELPKSDTATTWTRAAAAVVAAGFIAVASHTGDGSYHAGGLFCLAGAMVAIVIAASGWIRLPNIERSGRRSLLVLILIVLAIEFFLLLGRPMLNHARLQPADATFANGCLIAMAAIAVGPLLLPGRANQSIFVLLLVLVHGGLGFWLLQYSPRPMIDVWVQAQVACEAFSRGINPYTVTFPNIYGEIGPLVYPPGMVRDGIVQFGYQYMPLSFYPSYMSWKLTGDVRYGGLIALEMAALFIGLCGRGPFGRLGASLLLFFGAVYQVIENAWTEPYVICCLAATVYCVVHRPKLFPWVLGLLLVSKQHMPLAILAALLVTGFSWRSFWPVAWKAALVGAVVTLPMALWDFGAFFRGVFWVQLNNPFRADSLSFAAWYARQAGQPPLRMIELFAAALGAGLALWRCPRNVAGFALAIVAIYLPLFAFGKQAFTNYWFFSMGALATAVAALTAILLPKSNITPTKAPASTSPST